MKKLICIALAVILLLGSLVACSRKAKEPAFEEDVFEGTEATTEPATQDTESQDSTKSTEGNQSSGSTQPTQGSNSGSGQQNSGTTQPTESKATDPTESKPTTPTEGNTNQDPTEPTKKQDSTTPTSGQQDTKPTPPAESKPTESTQPTEETTDLAAEYEAYQNMSADQKKTFRDSFDNYSAFFAWYNAAKAAHKEANPPIPIGPDGVIELPKS